MENTFEPQKEFIAQLSTSWPNLSTQSLQERVAENLISPFVIQLPLSVLEEIKTAIRSYWELRESKSYQQELFAEAEQRNIKDPGNKSIMMSYDFHLDESQKIKLIEINTNAAFLALGFELYKMRNLNTPVPFDWEIVRSMILKELKYQNHMVGDELHIIIGDETPENQRLYIEFLVYQELFKSFGWNSEIRDTRNLPKKIDFLYNRNTDFYLTDPAHADLKRRWMDQELCLSPNPYEYLLLADKQRMIDWTQEGFLERMQISEGAHRQILSSTPRCWDFGKTPKEEIWSMRKKLFFKPKRAFGSRQSYKAATISLKIFNEMLNDEYLAQEYIQAPEQKFETPEGEQSFKFDLRCYAYEGDLQMIVARLYQGQVTNLKTKWGGFAPVIFG